MRHLYTWRLMSLMERLNIKLCIHCVLTSIFFHRNCVDNFKPQSTMAFSKIFSQLKRSVFVICVLIFVFLFFWNNYNRINVRAHNLVWGCPDKLPVWLENQTDPTLVKDKTYAHVRDMVRQFRGRFVYALPYYPLYSHR